MDKKTSGEKTGRDFRASRSDTPSYTRAQMHGGRGKAMRTLEFQKVSGRPRQTELRRPKPRRRPAEMTAQFGVVHARKVRTKVGVSALRDNAKQKVQDVRIRGAQLPWPMIAVAAACTIVVLAMVLNYVKLNELTNTYGSLQTQIVSLNADKRSLTLALDRKNDLIEIDYQAEQAGMVKNDRVEKRYVNLTGEDKIEVSEDEPGAIRRFLDSLKEGISDIISNIFG